MGGSALLLQNRSVALSCRPPCPCWLLCNGGIVCSGRSCGARRCVDRLSNTQMAKRGAHFRCPQHYCSVCGKSGDGVDMVKCIRCPTAYHSCCMPKHLRRLAPSSKVR